MTQNNNSKTIPVDQSARDIIVNNINENIFVEAGAGSGKTRSLVDRMVMMVRKGINVSEICAITFTKAAAVEFYNRFETELSNAIYSNIQDTEKERCKKALLNIDLCFMGTIDAFCNMILSENPIEAGIPLNSTIVEEEEYRFLIADEYNEIIDGVKTQDEKDALDDFLRFQYKPKEVFVESMVKLLSKRNYKIISKDRKTIQQRESNFYKKYQTEIKKLLGQIVLNHCEYINESTQGSREAKEYLKNNYWQIDEKWSEMPSSIIGLFDKGLKKATIRPNGFPNMSAAFSQYYELNDSGKYYKKIDNKMDEVINEYKSIQADYTLAFITKCIDKVSSNLISKGKLSYFDNLLLFRNLLKKDAANGGELIKHINSHHKYYLVDEFQDTDPLQAEIVFYLTAEKPDEDFTKCKPAPGTLFIVGDPNQSIYRFRNADIESYDFIKELFKNNNDRFLELTTNFRSRKKLIDYFNDQFKKTFNEKYAGVQAPFSQVDYYPDNKNSTNLEIDGVYQYESSKVTDEIKVANLIANLINRGYKYSDIMVLTYSRPPLKEYMEKFDELSIPYEIVGQSLFDKCEAFINLRYLLGAIANPDSSFRVYKALKMVFKLSDSHIYSIYQNERPNLLTSTKDPKIDQLVTFYYNNKDKDIISIFDSLLSEFNILINSNAKHLEYLYYAKELLREKVASSSIITLKEAYKYLCDLTDKNLIEKCLSLSRPEKDEKIKEDRILLANVHKVKGLERKIVILTCNASKKLSNSENSVEIHSSFKREENYVIRISKPYDPKNPSRINYIESDDYINEKKSEGVFLDCERERIAYVAATRAEEALFISSNSLNKDGEIQTPWGVLINKGSARSHIMQNDDLFKDSLFKAPTIISALSLSNKVISVDDNCRKPTYEIKSPSKLVHVLEKENEESSNPINSEASLKGTIVHRLMELYVSNKFDDKFDTYLTIIDNEYVLDKERKELLTNVFNSMKNGGFKQDEGKVTDLIDELKKSEEVICEAPFAYKEGNDIYNGIIDLLYKKDNRWFIVDYKTNFDPKELDKKYENQLEGYKKALSKHGIEADAYIYHIDVK